MIVIYGIEERLIPIREHLSTVIQRSLQDILNLPESKKAQRFIPMKKENFIYPEGRTDAYTVIEINIIEGRKIETKKKLIKDIFCKIENELQISPIDIEITIKEQPAHCWGFRGMTGDEAKDLTYKLDI